MQMSILVIGTMAATATIMAILDKKKRKLELELMQLMAIAEIEEMIRVNKFNHIREERKKLQKWRRYAIRSKKFRVRKKYRNKIRNYYTILLKQDRE